MSESLLGLHNLPVLSREGWLGNKMKCMLLRFFLLIVIMKRGRDIESFFAPVNKKVKETAVRETNQGIERAEEQEEGEPEESVEVGERACDESEGSDTEREIPEGEEEEEEGEEHEEEVKSMKTYRVRERNSQRDSKWIHVDQVLHHQVCDEEGSHYLQSSAITIPL